MDPTAHSPHVLIGESASASPSASPPPKKTSAKWQNAAMKANPKLDSDKLARAADISSKRLSKVKIQDSSSVSLMEIASRHLTLCLNNDILDMQPAPASHNPVL